MESTRNLARTLPATEDILRAIGLQSRHRSRSDLVPSVALFGAGVLVGVGLALLLAPTTGRELRKELSERAADLKDRASHTVESASSHVREQAY